MDGLKEIITSLDEAQQKEFIYFIQRNKYKKGRKDLLLFNLLKQPKAINQKDIITDLKTPNANGYHTIRKRLFNHLADFMIMKSVSSDASTKSHVNGLMAVINYLFDKNLDYYAWKYLDVAEKLALQHHYYDQLNSIFLLQIEKSPSNELIKLDKIIEKYQENKKHLELSERIKIAYSKIQNEYNFQKTKGITPDFEQLTLSILDQLKININVLQNPYILLEFTRITRAIALIKKDFLALEKFVLKNYNLCLKSNKELTTEVQGEFLYIVSHTTYRNKKFLDSIKALEELSNLIDTAPANFKRKYQNKINLLTAANMVFNEQLQEAIILLEKVKTEQLTTKDQITTNINLGVYYFLNGECKKALKQLSQLNHSDNWYIKQMGAEWLLKRYLMEVILFVEMEEITLAEARVNAIDRKFNKLKTIEPYRKAFNYIKIIKTYLKSPKNSSLTLTNEIEKQITFKPYEEEDLQAIYFYAWIKSKSVNQTFYSTLLGLIE